MNNKVTVCPKCGTRIFGDANVCSVCGHVFNPVDGSVPNNNEDYSKYIRENSDKSDNKDAAGLFFSGLIARILLPVVFPFVVMWFLFGGLNGSESKYWTVLIIALVIIIVLVLVPFKFTYNLAARDSSKKDKMIFFIGIILLLIALFIFFYFQIHK